MTTYIVSHPKVVQNVALTPPIWREPNHTPNVTHVYNAFDVCHELGRIAYRLNMNIHALMIVFPPIAII